MTDKPIRDAATVVLLRDGADGIESWLLTRVTQMVFAAGMSVFPGGRVDDADADLPISDDVAAESARRFGTDERTARSLIGAAVREVFEETGVLLTTPAPDLSAARTDVEAGQLSFNDLLRTHGLTVDAHLLRPWARWITPPEETRRYDTRFFLAALPAGADPQHVTTEASEAGWVPIRDALEQAKRGERGLLPPTLWTLSSVVQYPTVADALAASDQRDLQPISPNIRITADAIVAELPDGTELTIPRSIFR